MVSTSFPAGNPPSVSEPQYEILGATWGADGLIGAVGDSYPLYADSTGLQVKIPPGKYAHIHGRGWSSGDGVITLPVAPNASSQARTDLAVLGLDRSTLPWSVTEYVKTGTPALSPIPPPLVRDPLGAGTGKWEFPLGYINVPGGSPSTILPENVTAIPIYCGSQPLIVADWGQLQAIPGPYNGLTAQMLTNGVPYTYVYSSVTGWRRADWNTAWGIIGGQDFSATGAALAAGVGTQVNGLDFYLNMSSGLVGTVAGRRYAVRARWRASANGDNVIQVLNVRANASNGPLYGTFVVPSTKASVGYEWDMQREWSETTTATRLYMFTGYAVGGLMTVYRTLNPTDPAGVVLRDLGPTSALPGLA